MELATLWLLPTHSIILISRKAIILSSSQLWNCLEKQGFHQPPFLTCCQTFATHEPLVVTIENNVRKNSSKDKSRHNLSFQDLSILLLPTMLLKDSHPFLIAFHTPALQPFFTPLEHHLPFPNFCATTHFHKDSFSISNLHFYLWRRALFRNKEISNAKAPILF